MTEKKTSIATALAAAQMEMGKALKQSNNPHFRSKYADLGNVMDACLGPLNSHGIAVVQPTGENEHGRHVKTILIHGESGETLECTVPLIVQKNDMQGYGSAVTYARRYGLMAMAGIAPEDDDGNAAAKNPPKHQPRQQAPKEEPRDPQKICDSLVTAVNKAENENDLNATIGGEKFDAAWQWLAENHDDHSATVRRAVDAAREKFEKPRHSDDLNGSEIPY